MKRETFWILGLAIVVGAVASTASTQGTSSDLGAPNIVAVDPVFVRGPKWLDAASAGLSYDEFDWIIKIRVWATGAANPKGVLKLKVGSIAPVDELISHPDMKGYLEAGLSNDSIVIGTIVDDKVFVPGVINYEELEKNCNTMSISECIIVGLEKDIAKATETQRWYFMSFDKWSGRKIESQEVLMHNFESSSIDAARFYASK